MMPELKNYPIKVVFGKEEGLKIEKVIKM